MEVPLSVEPLIIKGKEQLEIWSNGKQQFVKPNSNPYFYTTEKISIPGTKREKLKAIQLSKYKEKEFYKHFFSTRQSLVNARIKGKTFEDNIPFILRNRLDNPDIYKKYRHTEELKFLFLDIEQYCKPEEPFPTYDDRIISVAWCGNDRKIKCAYLQKKSTNDKELLELFIREYKKINPDVFVVYNKSYDIPTILKRCMRNKIDISQFGKNDDNPKIIGKNKITIPGVVIYDVYDSTRVDQTLTGNVENRKLKFVSDYYGFKSKNKVLQGNEISNYIGTKELVGYNKEDVERLILLFDIYWPGIEYNANDLRLPLNFVTDLNTSNLGTIVIGDEYKSRNVIADGKNSDRYPEIFQVKREGGNYEGALVGITKTGLFKNVYKADVSSMYPSIMATFNLSPDTTSLLQYESYGKFKIEDEGNWNVINIPDKILQRNMVIQVLKKPGFVAELVKKFLNERAEYKKLWKKTNNPIYKAMSDNRKLKANGGVYGVQGAPSHPYGFVPLAIATTGIGRECAQLLIDILEELYPGSVTEFDTDGVYFHTNSINKQKILDMFESRLKEKFQKDLNLSIDIDEYDKGYFYKAKNYVLQRGDKLIFHGVAMKASSKTPMTKALIREVAKAKLANKPTDDIVKQYQKLDFPIRDFALNVTMGMHFGQYKQPQSTLVCQLALAAQRDLGIKPELGNQYYYIKTLNGYKSLELSRKNEIDKDYYLNEIDKVMKMFGCEVMHGTLDKWGI